MRVANGRQNTTESQRGRELESKGDIEEEEKRRGNKVKPKEGRRKDRREVNGDGREGKGG